MLPPTPSRAKSSRAEAGFSLLEAILVVSVTLVLVALTGKAMFSALNNYKLSSSARNVAAAVQLARVKATARNNRFRVLTDTTGTVHTFRIERCTGHDTSTNPPGCSGWALDAQSADTALAGAVELSIVGITTTAPGDTSGPHQAAGMTFNSRGLLIGSDNSPAENACFYLQRTGSRPMAVCTTMVGKTTIYRWSGATWQVQ
jgi:hypothetical protein